MTTALKCPKCSAQMEEGFVLEHRAAVRWISGIPEKSFLGDIKAAERDHRAITSYRCTACGFLESYAV